MCFLVAVLPKEEELSKEQPSAYSDGLQITNDFSKSGVPDGTAATEEMTHWENVSKQGYILLATFRGFVATFSVMRNKSSVF